VEREFSGLRRPFEELCESDLVPPRDASRPSFPPIIITPVGEEFREFHADASSEFIMSNGVEFYIISCQLRGVLEAATLDVSEFISVMKRQSCY
jgi:hypothetical protein